jgi:hypothetical protein
MLNIYDTSFDFDLDKDAQYFREKTYKLFNLSNNIEKTKPNITKPNINKKDIDKPNITKPNNTDKNNIDKNNIDKNNIDKNKPDINKNKPDINKYNIDKNKPDINKYNIDKYNIDKNNIIKYIIIDIKKSYIYNIWNDNLLKIIDHDIIISLFTIDEFKKYYIMDYEKNVIKSCKKFINFPLNKKSQCAHINVEQTICKNTQCGILAPFEDMKNIILIINKYISNNNIILLHCNHDYERLTVFLACIMLVNNYEIEYVLNIVNKYNIRLIYKNYIMDFLKYIKN